MITINGIGFIENSTNIDTSYTLDTNTNAITAGPITVDDGVVITISDNATWSVV